MYSLYPVPTFVQFSTVIVSYTLLICNPTFHGPVACFETRNILLVLVNVNQTMSSYISMKNTP